MSIGTFPSMRVAEARLKAAQLLRDLSQGKDPIAEKRAAIQSRGALQGFTFDKFANEFIESQKASWRNAKHAYQWERTMEAYVFPFVGKKYLNDVTTEDVLKILIPIWQTKTETASRVRGRVEKVLAAATVRKLREGLNPAQWKGHLEYLLPRPEKLQRVVHHPAMPYRELPSFIERLQGTDCLSALALEFCILAAARTSEVLLAKKDEINGALWTIPGERMKAGREHCVPLCDRALAIVKKADSLEPDSDYVFSRKHSPLSNMALLMLLRRITNMKLTVHGFRSTFRDWVAEETLHSPEVAEMALAHTIPNKVESAYRRGNLIEKRRALLNDWESYCMNTRSANIVLLRA